MAEAPSQFEVGTNGDVAVTVTVPLGARIGDNEVRIVGWDNTLGSGTLTVPEPSITVMPPQGQRGERATVMGSGFAANGIVLVSYGEETVGAGQSDARGNFEVSFVVPPDADIGRTYRVTAGMKVEGLVGGPLRAEADHAAPPAMVTVTPEWASPGRRMAVRGENLPPFAVVRPLEFGGRDITPAPNVSTNRNGSFKLEVTVPHVTLGDPMLRVEVLGVVVTRVVSVALPPLSGAPEDVFRELLEEGVLV